MILMLWPHNPRTQASEARQASATALVPVDDNYGQPLLPKRSDVAAENVSATRKGLSAQ
jgi:hypothetical protein